MKISTKGRYALRTLIDLATHQNEGYVTLKQIAERQNISKKYLEQIIPLLNRSGMLQASRGFQGGYRLTKTPENYTVQEILSLTEGDLAPVSCLAKNAEDCPHRAECPTIDLWSGLQKVIDDYLSGITLKDLINKNYPPEKI